MSVSVLAVICIPGGSGVARSAAASSAASPVECSCSARDPLSISSIEATALTRLKNAAALLPAAPFSPQMNKQIVSPKLNSAQHVVVHRELLLLPLRFILNCRMSVHIGVLDYGLTNMRGPPLALHKDAAAHGQMYSRGDTG